MSGNIRNMRDTFLHFLADNLPANSVHPVRWDKKKPEYNALQVSSLNVTFHDAVYSPKQPTSQFITLDILHDDELAALDLEESVVALLQLGGYTKLLDYSAASGGSYGSTRFGVTSYGDPGPQQVSNFLVFWNPESIKFRTVASADYFHRAAVLELFVRYI